MTSRKKYEMQINAERCICPQLRHFYHQKEVCDKEKGRENPFEDLDPQRGPYFQVYLKET